MYQYLTHADAYALTEAVSGGLPRESALALIDDLVGQKVREVEARRPLIG